MTKISADSLLLAFNKLLFWFIALLECAFIFCSSSSGFVCLSTTPINSPHCSVIDSLENAWSMSRDTRARAGAGTTLHQLAVGHLLGQRRKRAPRAWALTEEWKWDERKPVKRMWNAPRKGRRLSALLPFTLSLVVVVPEIRKLEMRNRLYIWTQGKAKRSAIFNKYF